MSWGKDLWLRLNYNWVTKCNLIKLKQMKSNINIYSQRLINII